MLGRVGELVYDPRRPDFQDHAYAIYGRLREEAPCYENPEAGFFAISRFEDVRAAACDPAAFSSEGTDISQGILPMIQMLDPPRHDALRALVSKAFTPRRVADLEPRIREIARELIDDFAGRGEADLLAEFARHLPSRVMGELIGVPPERREAFLRWTEAFVEADPSAAANGAVATGERSRTHPAIPIYREFSQLLAARRERRAGDLMSALLDAEIDGQRLTDEELLGFCFVLIVAGNDTTTGLIANGARLLADHPDQRKLLLEEPRRIPDAVEEMLRFESPVQALSRVARREVELHGRRIPAGALVRLVWGSANRDPREFEDPERFDVTRQIPRHLALGQGVHFCLGANLARLEARVAFEELLARIPDYGLRRRPRWLTSIWARAHDAVEVSFPPARL
jgi:cytochrome P450